MKARLLSVVLGLLCAALTPPAAAFAPAPTTQTVDVGFSPAGTAEALVIRSIQSARKSIRLAAYSFTDPKVVRALMDAKKRGADVAVVVDKAHNSSKAARAALNLLVNAGIPTRTVDAYKQMHSKYAVIDGKHVQTGSYNYSNQAANRNAENVLVVWNQPDLAASYAKNWQWLYEQGQPYTSSY
jgi:phosphatidylserine/phosphatidylglycerophosphate/cardiolipin synthase-like enzyme